MRPLRPLWHLIALALLPAACADLGNSEPLAQEVAVQAAPAPVPPQKKAAEVKHPRVASDRPAARHKPKEKSVDEAKIVSTATPASQSVTVLGKTEEEIVKLLGRPGSETALPPGKILVFPADSCKLEVYVFPDVNEGGFRALEVKAIGSLPVAKCLAQRLAPTLRRDTARANPDRAQPGRDARDEGGQSDPSKTRNSGPQQSTGGSVVLASPSRPGITPPHQGEGSL